MIKKAFISCVAIIALAACNHQKTTPVAEDGPVQTDTVKTTQITVGPDSLNGYIATHPNDAEALAARSAFYLNQKNYKYAFADANAAMQLDSMSPEVLLAWGDIHYVQNRTRVSRNAWEKCIRIDKKSIDCRLKLAELYNIVQEYGKSIQLVDEVIDIDPEQAVAYYIKGINVRDMKGDTNTALQYFQRAIDLDNNYLLALDMMGVMLATRKDPMALAYYNRILEIDPNNYPTYYNMGMFYLKTKDWNNAIIAFTKCTQLKPNDIESLFNLGYIHIELKQYKLARDYFDQALAIQPINHRALYGRGYAYEMLGDVIKAEKDYQEALSYNPQHEASRIARQRLKAQ